MRHGRQLIGVKDAAQMFGLPIGTVMAAVHRGDLLPVQGTRGLLSVRDVARFVSVLVCVRRARGCASRTKGSAGS